MRVKNSIAVFLLPLLALGVVAAQNKRKQDWTHSVRIGAYGLQAGKAE